MYADVIVDIAHTAVDRTFSYHIPSQMDIANGQQVMVPFGTSNKPREGFVVALHDTCDVENAKDILRAIVPYTVLLDEQIALARWMQSTYHCLFIDALRLMIPSQLRGGRIREKTERVFCLADGVDVEASAATLRSDQQKQILAFVVSKHGEVRLSDIRAGYPSASATVASLVKKGILAETTRIAFRAPGGIRPEYGVCVLTDEQSTAVDGILSAMQRGGETVLVHGVTGSGKTEVYLRIIAHCLKAGKQAIMLVPEISLTPQTLNRFTGRFPGKVAVLHSRLSAGERFDEWRRIRLGHAQIVVGARSAIFAPVENLGLVVMDEEHEPSYQSDKNPRYHALEVAAFRLKSSAGTLILGSATPSLMSYYRALNGRYRLIEMTHRVNNRPLPVVETIDMKTEYLAGNNGIFSERLCHLIQQCLTGGNQAMLFLNRRGYSTFVACRSCGYVLKCAQCDVSMTYHKAEKRVKCHYCGASIPLPNACPNCRKPFIKYFGVGTEQVEEELTRRFPGVSCIRMDADTMTGKDAYAACLARFANREAQVLIGTQMIAKGHDFPHVTLVGIVSADTSLFLPDFRSEERAFQLITQVAGRAGRDADAGHVVLQTQHPEHPVVRFAEKQDYVGYFHYEMAARRRALYPPFSLFIRILFHGPDEAALTQRGNEYARALEMELRRVLGQEGKDDLLLLSASAAPVARIAGQYRYQIVIKLLRTNRLRTMFDTVYEFDRIHASDTMTNIEINPLEMY